MNRYTASAIVLIAFIIFSVFLFVKSNTNRVLNILEPNIIQVDLNSNGIIDDNETICIADVEAFSLSQRGIAPDFAPDNLKITEIIALEYLADEFANSTLLYKPVKVKFNGAKSPDCRHGEIYIDNKKYSQKLYESGFAAIDGEYSKDNFDKNLEKANKLKLVILNHKSYKYHRTDCEYGLASSDFAVIPEKQLPADAIPCKFCHIEKNTKLEKPNTAIYNGNIRLILTDFTTKLKPDRECTSEVCNALLNEIVNTKNTIDIAAYGWDNIPKLQTALKNAKQRGIRIRLVYDKYSSTAREFYKETSEFAKLSDYSNSDYVENNPTYTDKLMHNKFIIFDNKTVFTGSMNFSSTGLSGYNANTIVILNSQEIAKLYTAEFEQMLSGKFHNLKHKTELPNIYKIGKSKVSIYFSPYDKSSKYIIPIIDNAKNYIYMPAFLITHTEITNALIRAKSRGVDVKIIVDANSTSTRHTKNATLRANGIKLKTENYAGRMHSKSIIVDDKYIITGSMNFSNSGENKNDENILIIEDAELAAKYKTFFQYLWEKIPDIWLNNNVHAESRDSIGSCSDGIDNDFDGKIDSEDEGCFNLAL